MRFYVCIPLPVRLKEKVSTFSKEWEVQSKSEPHITIIVPRSLPEGVGLRELTGAIAGALSSVRPFIIQCREVGQFDDKQVIHLPIERSSGFADLHQALRTEIERVAGVDVAKFAHVPEPHITLASGMSPEKAEPIWDAAHQIDWTDEFACKELHLMVRGPDDPRWIVSTAFHL
ncbi:MAG TPA: 2'-5' RNA ligase family protein [Verrucomicrobiae bacterium]|nr:2'-5' RNA ligase family protein [Verrucomicrobiae bacterium]